MAFCMRELSGETPHNNSGQLSGSARARWGCRNRDPWSALHCLPCRLLFECSKNATIRWKRFLPAYLRCAEASCRWIREKSVRVRSPMTTTRHVFAGIVQRPLPCLRRSALRLYWMDRSLVLPSQQILHNHPRTEHRRRKAHIGARRHRVKSKSKKSKIKNAIEIDTGGPGHRSKLGARLPILLARVREEVLELGTRRGSFTRERRSGEPVLQQGRRIQSAVLSHHVPCPVSVAHKLGAVSTRC